jgi:hypothetical protein
MLIVILSSFGIFTMLAISLCLLPRGGRRRVDPEPPDVLDHEATSEPFAADLVDFNDAASL